MYMYHARTWIRACALYILSFGYTQSLTVMEGLYTILFVGAVAVGGFFLVRRTKDFWIRLLFPLGYLLYSRTRLGYHFHLRQLHKKRLSPHSFTQPLSLSASGVEIIPIAILDDNYSYLVTDLATKTSAVIDPSDPGTVQKKIEERGVTLKAILTTHKHWDHSGGNEALKSQFRTVEVYGGVHDSVPGVTHALQDRERVQVGQLSFEALWTPGHTVGHMVFLLHSQPPCLFSGDHIFIGGNGRMFELGPERMLKSIKTVMELAPNCLIFPGASHEYSLMNLQFASTVEPHNIHIKNKLQWVKQQRTRRLATVPSILSEELQYNLFMCTNSTELREALQLPPHTPEPEVLAEVRRHLTEFQRA